MSYSHLSKAQLSRFRKLKLRKYRDSEGLFLAEGLRTVEQILKHGLLEVRCIILDEKQISDQRLTGFTPGFKATFLLEHELFVGLCDTEQSQGVLAVVSIPEAVPLSEIKNLQGGLILAVDAIQDPGNLGTIYRTASWFGASLLIAGEGSVDLFNPKSVRSTAGALGSLGIQSNIELTVLLGELANLGWKIYLLDAAKDSVPISDIKLSGKDILVVGNEANGISNTLKSDRRFKKVVIPGNATHVESLNAAVSASIAMHHFSAY